MTFPPQLDDPGGLFGQPAPFSPAPPAVFPASGRRRMAVVGNERAVQTLLLRLALEPDDEDEEPDDEDDDWDDFEAAHQEPEPPWEVWDPLDDEPAEPDQHDFWPDLPDDDD